MTASSLVPLPALAADIGGTNARFALLGANGEASDPIIFPIAEYSDVAAALAQRVLPSLPDRPRSIVFALAANIQGDEAKLTHGHWTVAPRALRAAFDLLDIVLLNDFEALALSLPMLSAENLKPVGERKAETRGPKLVLGAGTGLGVGALIPVGDSWLPITTEGGHIDFGAAHQTDFEVWQNLPLSVGRVTTETVIAGAGIANIYRSLKSIKGRDPGPVDVTDVVDAAKTGTDATASEAVKLFARHLGRFAGNMVLLYMARGGVYIGGGVVGRLGDLFDEQEFCRAFRDKAPFSAMLEAIPTQLITHPTPALLGIASLITQPERYIIDLTGRHWRGS